MSIRRLFEPERWGFTCNEQDHLTIGGCDTVDLAEAYGTPLHIVDEEGLRKTARDFRAIFGDSLGDIDVFYSYKTNCIPGILRVLHEEGIGAEAISTYETWLALELGLPGERILLNGVNKSVECLRLAVSHDLRSINVDSMEEVDRLASVIDCASGPVRVGVRVSTGAGWKAQFGVEIGSGEALEVFRRLGQIRNVLLSGIHVHLGTSIESPSVYARAVAAMFDLRVEVKKATNIVLNYLDLGGGLPVSTVREFGLRDTVFHRRLRLRAVPPDLRRPGWPQFAAAIAKAIDGGVARTGMPRPQIFFEPGRALTSQAQLLLLRVGIVKKRTAGNLIAISDGGRSTNAMPLSTEYHEVFLANRMSAVGECPHTIVGGLCTPGDWTFMRKDLPLLESGDLLAVMDSGAYFTSFANNFSFPRPAIVMVRDGQARVIRRRESFESMVAMDEGMVVRPMPRPSVFP